MTAAAQQCPLLQRSTVLGIGAANANEIARAQTATDTTAIPTMRGRTICEVYHTVG